MSLVMLFCITILSAQEFSMDLVKNMKPRNIGPGGMSGRVTTIDVVTKNPEINNILKYIEIANSIVNSLYIMVSGVINNIENPIIKPAGPKLINPTSRIVF